MLTLDHVSKVYKVGTFGGKELHAVSDVSFNVKDGEVVSLIGESGSGKTTLGRMILGLVSISSGAITFNGEDISALRRSELKDYYRKVQGVFQDPFSSYNPIFKADRVFGTIRDEFFPDIEDIQFLVADEIISMLDASTRIDVLNLLADLKARGLSVLFITHDLSLGYYISERAVILYRGHVMEMGATEKLYANPLHPYTKMLMAAVPRLDQKWEDVEVKLGAMRAELSRGCVYYERCPAANRQGCDLHKPTLIEAESDHFVACGRYPKEPPPVYKAVS
jgi:peptide/nickel transport system ATP-binding protein